MCGGVSYQYQGKDHRTYFPVPTAQLPVLKSDGHTELVTWGRRKQQDSILPLGGWARHDSIVSGRWDRYFPKPVKIIVSSFMEKDYEGISRWYDLIEGTYIQGLLVRDGHTIRVYVVTVEPSFEDAHERMPRLLMCLGAKHVNHI